MLDFGKQITQANVLQNIAIGKNIDLKIQARISMTDH